MHTYYLRILYRILQINLHSTLVHAELVFEMKIRTRAQIKQRNNFININVSISHLLMASLNFISLLLSYNRLLLLLF